MSVYRIENCIVDTKNAVRSWEQKRNKEYESKRAEYNLGELLDYLLLDKMDETVHKKARSEASECLLNACCRESVILYESRKGRFYIECIPINTKRQARAEWVSPQEAARWLLLEGLELPKSLEQYVDEISE